MTNREKYADILATIQAEHPNNHIEDLVGLTHDTKQPVSCRNIKCMECIWNGTPCQQNAIQWLDAPADNTNEVKEKKQMKKKYVVTFEGNEYYLLLSDEQVKVFYFLGDAGWDCYLDEFEGNFKEL